MRYVATINVPGYLPMDDDPPVFDTAREAWEYLAGERKHAEDDYPDDSDVYSETYDTLTYIASGDHVHGNAFEDTPTNADGTGTVCGETPGAGNSPYDLGLAYTVSVAEEG